MSWYKSTHLNPKQVKYLKLLQEVWKVKDAEGQWISYKLTPHQIEFHSNDIAVLGEDAKSTIVVKSRNTSFTVSTLIRMMSAVPNYPEQIVPLVRLNMTRACDLLDEAKELIRHMTPIRLKNGSLYPFDPSMVDMEKLGSIKFPNGVEFRAMPATAQSAEAIRGMRIRGIGGVIDESNFMRDFTKIYISLRDASAGSKGGKKHFQMNIGTTRKGMLTNFNLWFEEIERKQLENMVILRWPVFKPGTFDIDKSIFEQPGLSPIVSWHTLEDLEDKRKEDKQTFSEEYLAILTSDDNAFYPIDKIMLLIDDELINYNLPPEEGAFYMGIDPSGEGELSDYFSVSIFEEQGDMMVQRKLFYHRDNDLDVMFKYICKLVDYWNPIKIRIDANMLGYQLGQSLKKKYGNRVDVIRGNIIIKVRRDFNVSINEYMHTNQKRLIVQGKVKFISDEVQIHHFTGWDYKFNCIRTKEYGHGDTTISNALALLPLKWRSGEESSQINIVRRKEVKTEDKDEKGNKLSPNEAFNKMNMLDRLKYYKKQNRSNY